MSSLVGNLEDRFSIGHGSFKFVHVSEDSLRFPCLSSAADTAQILTDANEPRREKTGFLHMRKQRRRTALQRL